MLDRLQWKYFAEISLEDPFFVSLRSDYDGFDAWYKRKIEKEEKALTLYEGNLLHAFLYLKDEEESIELKDSILPCKKRLKIGTFKIDDSIGGQRLGEGMLGVALWKWQESKTEEIYVTTFSKQEKLMGLFAKFGFHKIGEKENGEFVFAKNRTRIDFSDPYKAFPFISSKVQKAGILPINDFFHDRLFPYSETRFTPNEVEELTAGNGITKVYIGSPSSVTHYSQGDVVFIYRKYNGAGAKGNKSVITSFCTVTKVTIVKRNNFIRIPLNQYLKDAGNKTVFTEDELKDIYQNSNVVMIEMTYNGFFGKGKNVSYWDLKNRGLFEEYPYNIVYDINQIKQILELGDQDVKNIIINQA